MRCVPQLLKQRYPNRLHAIHCTRCRAGCVTIPAYDATCCTLMASIRTNIPCWTLCICCPPRRRMQSQFSTTNATRWIAMDHRRRRRGNFVEVVASQPSLATCDLVRAGLMLPIDSFYYGWRQFAAFKPNTTATHHAHGLPCSMLCSLRWHTEARSKKWSSGGGLKLSSEQHAVRRASCSEKFKRRL